MKWIANVLPPDKFRPSSNGQTPEEYRTWLNQFIVGEPEASIAYTSKELAEMGYVGLYEKEVKDGK